MKAVQLVKGTAVPMSRADVDTDAIIPQRWLITTEREGLGIGLFSNWRYRPASLDPDPAFILNEPRFSGAKIIVAAANYGCGSSREHAVWAHLDYGIEAIIAPSYGPIFYDNALKNGLVVVTLDEAVVAAMLQMLAEMPANTMTVDLVEQTVSGPDGQRYDFDMDEQRRRAILSGQDDIAATLTHLSDIEEFENRDRARNPWLWA